MKCLYCGKKIENGSPDEIETEWHKRCVKKFFNTPVFPSLDLSEEALNQLADHSVNKGLTVPGVQKKLSLHLSKDQGYKLTIVNYPTGYILKPQSKEYDSLPEAEYMAMQMAKEVGISTVPFAMIKMNSEYAFITKRVDRLIKGDTVEKYAMEDFCQLSNKMTNDKYKSSYEACGRIINRFSETSGFDQTEFFARIVFSFLIGNSDMHLKNFSLREYEVGSRQYRLSEAYDMLPVNIIMPEDTEQLALTLNGKKKNITKKCFIKLQESCGINEKAASNIIKKMCSKKNQLITICDESLLSDEFKDEWKKLFEKRLSIFSTNDTNK